MLLILDLCVRDFQDQSRSAAIFNLTHGVLSFAAIDRKEEELHVAGRSVSAAQHLAQQANGKQTPAKRVQITRPPMRFLRTDAPR